MIEQLPDLLAVAERCVQLARRAGADLAEADVTARAELAVKVRNGRPDVLHHNGEHALRLHLVKDQRAAVIHTNHLVHAGLKQIVADALELAALASPDPFLGAVAKSELARYPLPGLSLWDDSSSFLDVRESTRRAVEGERAARAHDPRVLAVESSCGYIHEGFAFATTAGFSGAYATSYQALMVEAVAEAGTKSVSRHFTASRFLQELDEPELVGTEAARRAIAQIGTREIAARDVPVVFHPDAGRTLLQLLSQVLSGTSVVERASYLNDRLGTRVASDLVNVIDDPVVPRAVGSRPFDAEGLRSRSSRLIDKGILRTFLTNAYAARRLRRPPTASAVRNGQRATISGSSNLILLPGTVAPAQLIAGLSAGLYVTELMGASFRPATGDVARVASGFWVENGELAYPVSRVHLAAPLDAILGGVDAVCHDLDFRTAFACPTVRVAELRIGTR